MSIVSVSLASLALLAAVPSVQGEGPQRTIEVVTRDLTIPEEIAPAIAPYLDCLIAANEGTAKSGNEVADAHGPGCEMAKARARAEAIAMLRRQDKTRSLSEQEELVDQTIASIPQMDGAVPLEGGEMALFQQFAGEVQFQTYISTPDVLDPAMVPYMDCAAQSAGISLVDSAGEETLAPEPGRDCSAERERARRLSSEILIAEGISSPTLRDIIINLTFNAIDRNSQAMNGMNSNGS